MYILKVDPLKLLIRVVKKLKSINYFRFIQIKKTFTLYVYLWFKYVYNETVATQILSYPIKIYTYKLCTKQNLNM